MSINSQLLDIEQQLKDVISSVKAINNIEGDTVDLNLERIEGKIELLRELVDFRIGKFD